MAVVGSNLTRGCKHHDLNIIVCHEYRESTMTGSTVCHAFLAERIFIKLERARAVLLDKDKRAKYDHWRTGGFRNVISFEKWLEMQNAIHTVS